MNAMEATTTCPDCGRHQGFNGHAYAPCGNRTYEYPLGVTFRAYSGPHAAARVFGGKPHDYLTTRHQHPTMGEWLEVSTSTGAYVGEIPIRAND